MLFPVARGTSAPWRALCRTNLWNDCASRATLDQRAREAYLQLERIERLFVPYAAVTHSWLKRSFILFRHRHLLRRIVREPDLAAAEKSTSADEDNAAAALLFLD